VSDRRELLLITPVTPAKTGNGLAMRAGLFLEALATDFDVSLLVVPVAGPRPARWPSFVTARTAHRECAIVHGRADAAFEAALTHADPTQRLAALRVYPRPALCRFATADNVEAAARRYDGRRFDAIHVMRLYMAPFAAPFLDRAGPASRTVLDLDDDETATRRGLATLHAARGEWAAATLEAAEAEKYAALESTWLGRFDRALVCHEEDRAALRDRAPTVACRVVPNGVPLPSVPPTPRARDGAFRMLFVGSLGYFPNVAAAELLCREILPLVGGSAEVLVDLVGRTPAPEIRRLADTIPAVRLHADVRDVGGFYADADAAMAPIRAGGGTRIKLLEAFAHRVPVVTTRVGAEGLDAQDGVHLLLGETPDAMATACRRLMSDPALGDRLRGEAARLVAARYETSVVERAIRRVYQELLASPAPGSPA
jgi:glycosyltransferase involved in cell wall biosynthesis